MDLTLYKFIINTYYYLENARKKISTNLSIIVPIINALHKSLIALSRKLRYESMEYNSIEEATKSSASIFKLEKFPQL